MHTSPEQTNGLAWATRRAGGGRRGASRRAHAPDASATATTPATYRTALRTSNPTPPERDELLQRVWGRRATHRDRTVDVFVRKLREKVDRRAPRHTFLHTRYGVGYKLEAEPK